MSDGREEHARKWRIPLEEVAGQTSGHLVDPPNFQTIELLANIKRGSEVVLGGVASMPDVLEKIKELRIKQDEIIQTEKQIVADYELATKNGASEEDKKEWLDWKNNALIPLHAQFKRTRMELARHMVGSLVNHVLLETGAVEGERAKQIVEINKAQVLQDRNDFERLFPEKKKRSLRHPLGS